MRAPLQAAGRQKGRGTAAGTRSTPQSTHCSAQRSRGCPQAGSGSAPQPQANGGGVGQPRSYPCCRAGAASSAPSRTVTPGPERPHRPVPRQAAGLRRTSRRLGLGAPPAAERPSRLRALCRRCQHAAAARALPGSGARLSSAGRTPSGGPRGSGGGPEATLGSPFGVATLPNDKNDPCGNPPARDAPRGPPQPSKSVPAARPRLSPRRTPTPRRVTRSPSTRGVSECSRPHRPWPDSAPAPTCFHGQRRGASLTLKIQTHVSWGESPADATEIGVWGAPGGREAAQRGAPRPPSRSPCSSSGPTPPTPAPLE